MRSLLFATGDVGGARALHPIIALAAARGLGPLVLRHGAMTNEVDVGARWVTRERLSFATPETKPAAYVFAGSVADAVPLQVARLAHAHGVPTVFVLDSWSSYAARLSTDGGPAFKPSVYCVPDEKAKADAAQEGIGAAIRVTGQPAFADIVSEAKNNPATHGTRARILLVSEPVEADHGRNRGYTEAEVLALVGAALKSLSSHVEVDVAPHPRDDARRTAELWDHSRGSLAGTVLAQNTLKSVAPYDGIIGMASVLLYRGWLLGKPVLSCQPNLKLPSLRQFGDRQGLRLVEDPATATAEIEAWAATLMPGRPMVLRDEAHQHAAAPDTILDTAYGLSMESTDDR